MNGKLYVAQPNDHQPYLSISPLPYYPYLEPDRRVGKASASPRLLEIWLASTRNFVPVASRSGKIVPDASFRNR